MRFPASLAAALSCFVLGGTPSLAAPVAVSIAVDANASGTRLLLTFADPVEHSVDSSEGKIEIRFAKPIEIRPPLRYDGDDLLRRVRLKDDDTLVLTTGPAYARHELFELRNPSRLIVDLTGQAQARGAGERTRNPVVPKQVVVIDPGHGGIENGAVGPTGGKEKDVTLDLARRLRTRLSQLDPGSSVVLTRDEDRLVGLDERTAIANHNRADLFVSIHLNASPRSQASGAETYFLSAEATDDEARILAGLENRSAGGEEKAPKATQEGGAPPGLDLVLWDLAQNQYLAESSTLAEAVQAQLNQATGTRDRGVRQAPFRVLMGATMPAILVEVGFISNPEEEARLQTTDYRDTIADALSVAVRDFLKRAKQLDGSPERP